LLRLVFDTAALRSFAERDCAESQSQQRETIHKPMLFSEMFYEDPS